MSISDFLITLSNNKSGIIIFFLCLFLLLFLLHWACWVIGIGRFKRKTNGDVDKKQIRFIIAELLVQIINDFRHLLALIIVMIFALVLILGLLMSEFKIENMAGALQAVVSTLGGLVGSIIGYYFGESAAKRGGITRGEPEVETIGIPQAVQSPDQADEDDSITPLPKF